MGMGNEMMAEAMIDQMIAEEEAEEQAREIMFDEIGHAIHRARTIPELQDCLIVLLNLIKDKT